MEGLFCGSQKWSVGHVDLEMISKLSSLMTYFMRATQANQLFAAVIAKQGREVV